MSISDIKLNVEFHPLSSMSLSDIKVHVTSVALCTIWIEIKVSLTIPQGSMCAFLRQIVIRLTVGIKYPIAFITQMPFSCITARETIL